MKNGPDAAETGVAAKRPRRRGKRAPDDLAHVDPATLVGWDRNPRVNDAAVEPVARSIERFGFGAPVVARPSDRRVLAGHTRLKAAALLGLATVPVRWLELAGPEADAYALADNRLGELAEGDDARLDEVLRDLRDADVEAPGFNAPEVEALLAANAPGRTGLADPDAAPEAPAESVTRPGDLWVLGDHRLLCGDATDADAVRRLLDGATVDAVLTDPPYCSGGFQEAGRGQGSKGSTQKNAANRSIRNDVLSTRGMLALVGTALRCVDARAVYCFTDWRQWVVMFDLAESLGYGVRAMVVWDKGSPGMGLGWRPQHELILFGVREKVWRKEDKNWSAVGDVLAVPRQPNSLHPTQKPVALLRRVLDVSPWAERVADPFVGSGSTLLACEAASRRCFALEIEPRYVDVAVRRWEEYTGKKAVRA